MNQHASRPVAKGFPLHRRMNGSIQTAGPRTTTPLRTSNSPTITNGGPLRRPLFKSQIPIRIDLGAAGSQPSQQALLHAQALERRQMFSASQNSPSATLQAMRTSSNQQPLETAIKFYEDRLQTDLGDFRAMCTRLILKEKEEKEKWRTLCLKMMKERDTARQRVSALISEREIHLSSSSLSSSPSAAPCPASSTESLASKASKRTREETNSQENTQELPSLMEPRPIRSLRSSPIPSPPASPSASLHNSSTAVNSSSLPSSASSPPPLIVKATISPMSATPSTPPATPLNIMTFNPTRSPNDKTCFDVFSAIDIPETRLVKRRKSYDSFLSGNKTMEDGEIDESIGPSQEDKEAEALPPRHPFLIAHTDIMYVPMKGRLFCRACLLDKTTHPSSNRQPKTFPTDVDWDELRDHCVNEHPTACADVARLCPADLHEVRRRLYNM